MTGISEGRIGRWWRPENPSLLRTSHTSRGASTSTLHPAAWPHSPRGLLPAGSPGVRGASPLPSPRIHLGWRHPTQPSVLLSCCLSSMAPTPGEL